MRAITLSTLFIVLASASLAQNFPNGLYYRFNEGAGATTQNLANPMVGGVNGNLVGTPGWAAGRFGSAYANVGTATNYVDTGWNTNLVGTSWTLEFWVNLNSITTTISYMCGETSTSFRAFSGGVAGSNGIILRGTGITDCWINPAVPAAATWTHVAFVYDRSTLPAVLYGYLNGVLAVTSSQAAVITAASTLPFRVGGQTSTTSLNGAMDEFRLWFVARSAADILGNYNSEVNDRNILVATTTGGGAGDLSLALTNIDPAAVEGYMLLTATPATALGGGPLFGINPDALTWSIFSQPSIPGSPLHFPIGFPGYFPDVPFTVPPGTLTALSGQTWDLVAVMLGTGLSYAGRSAVNRLHW